MPPELPHFRSFASPVVRFSPLSSPETLCIFSLGLKSLKENHRMKIPVRKIIPSLVFILSTISVLRLLRLANFASSSKPSSTAFNPNLQDKCNSTSRKCRDSSSHEQSKSTVLTKKELNFLINIIKGKAPCNLLRLGATLPETRFNQLWCISVFLEDDIERIRKIRLKSNNTRIYKVDYHVPVNGAYELLKHARKNSSCALSSIQVQNSTCKLALINSPEEIYEQKWDVIVVDGPSGDSLKAPGRMAAIYTAVVMARSGNTTDVFVHDVNRMVERQNHIFSHCHELRANSK